MLQDITKLTVTELEPAQTPKTATILQLRNGKVQKLGNETSAIFKKEIKGRCLISTTGIIGDEHVYYNHGGAERALHQYCPEHYPILQSEAPKPELFNEGGFGENLVSTELNEENVCIGDIFDINGVIVQVSEPRNPCYKLNMRFEWKRALKRIQRLGWVGWNFRVLKAGYVQAGDKMVLLERPHPEWSIMNVKKVLGGKASIELLRGLAEIPDMTDMPRDAAWAKVDKTPKSYVLAEAKMITSRVRQMTFQLQNDLKRPFVPFAWAQIEFDKYKRSYSIVSGDMNRFTLGIALDDHSRGGSAYLHKMEIGEEIKMAPGSKNEKDDWEGRRIVIIGGIGVTAFLPSIAQWQAEDTPFEVHYAVRDPKDVAYLERLPETTKLYSRPNRLDVKAVIPEKPAKIYSCGPKALMDAIKDRCEEFHYPEEAMHFESFSADGGASRGDPFEASIKDTLTGKTAEVTVPSDKSLLQVLRDAGFDMVSFCEVGLCGACKVSYCGKVEHKEGTNLQPWEKPTEMLSCIERGVGKVEIELD